MADGKDTGGSPMNQVVLINRLTGTKFALGGTRFLWTLDRDECFTFLDVYAQLFEKPILDTADSYVQWVDKSEGGESEEIIGDWMSRRENREKIFLCTKIGKKSNRQGLGFNNIVEATNESLGRLKTNYVDLLMLHSWTSDSEIIETAKALSHLYENGLVHHMGISNFPPQMLKSIHEELLSTVGVGVSFIQYHYNLIERDATVIQFDSYSSTSNFGFESQILPWAEDNCVVSMPYHPLARGFLSDKYLRPVDENTSIHQDRVIKYFGFNVKPLLLEMDRMSEHYGTKIPNIALAWLLSRGRHILPTVSFSTIEQMLSLATLPTLAAHDLNLLTLISGEIGPELV